MLIQEDLKAWKVRIRELVGAGEPLNPEVIEQVKAAWGLTIRDGYGQTETTALVGNSPGQAVKPGSMGRPLPGYRVALLDVNGKEHKEGEICLVLAPRPTGLMQGYQADDGGVRAMDDAVYRTGDVGSVDDDGYLTYVGRADDVFKSSDYRISPFELESVLDRASGGGRGGGGAVAGSDAACGAESVSGAGARPRAGPRYGAVDLPALPHRAGAIQAGAAARIRRVAEDDLRQDPPRRAAAR